MQALRHQFDHNASRNTTVQTLCDVRHGVTEVRLQENTETLTDRHKCGRHSRDPESSFAMFVFAVGFRPQSCAGGRGQGIAPRWHPKRPMRCRPRCGSCEGSLRNTEHHALLVAEMCLDPTPASTTLCTSLGSTAAQVSRAQPRVSTPARPCSASAHSLMYPHFYKFAGW